MKLSIRLNHFLRRCVCYFRGHVRRDASIDAVGISLCRRCLRILHQRTVRAQTTRGDVERRMAAYPPEGYRFVDCNWRKRKAKFVAASGKYKFVWL